MGLTGAILSGGESSRMGTDKGLIRYKDKYLVEYGIEILKQLCKQVYIGTKNIKYEIFNLPLLPDEYPNLGPIGGIYTALKKSKQGCLILIF